MGNICLFGSVIKALDFKQTKLIEMFSIQTTLSVFALQQSLQ